MAGGIGVVEVGIVVGGVVVNVDNTGVRVVWILISMTVEVCLAFGLK